MTTQNITTDTELWKPVVGYEGLYEVSDHGYIRSLDRFVKRCYGGARWIRGQLRQPSVDRDGYLCICLSSGGETKTFKMHRLVLTAFRSEPFEDAVCMHLDNDRKNNHISNLRWGTVAENNKYCEDRGRANHPKGEINGNSKLTKTEVLEIRGLYIGGVLQRELAVQFCITQTVVSKIVNRQIWKHI